MTKITIERINLTGQCILTKQQTHEVDLSAYPKGIYVVKAHSASTIYTEKILVQ